MSRRLRGKKSRYSSKESKIFSPRRAITFDTGFMMAASAFIFCLVTVLPAVRSTMATWGDSPASTETINFSDSNVVKPNLTASGEIDKGGLTN